MTGEHPREDSAVPASKTKQDFDRCTKSKYGTHRFTVNVWQTCDFCGRDWRQCLAEKESQ